MAYALSFYVIAALILISACGVVFSRNILYSAVSLIFTLIGVAAIYGLLSDDFMAVIQMLLYIGGILVLILFAIMLTDRIEDSVGSNLAYSRALASLLSVCALVGLVAGLLGTDWKIMDAPEKFVPSAARIGHSLLGPYLLPFEIISVLLLVGLVGAVCVARKEFRTEDERS